MQPTAPAGGLSLLDRTSSGGAEEPR